jgi:hypothetical protein
VRHVCIAVTTFAFACGAVAPDPPRGDAGVPEVTADALLVDGAVTTEPPPDADVVPTAIR